MNPFAALALVLAALSGLIGLVFLAKRFSDWPPELSRKAVHIGMGCVCLTFPRLFQENGPVFLLAFFAVLGLLSIRFVPALKSRFGDILGGVNRSSWGEIYFPVAVAAAFALRGGNDLLFIIPILQLTLSDAIGALIGIRYGVHRFHTDDGQKSAEGSFAIGVVAFLATFIPLQLSGFEFQVSIPISLLIALILTLMEAISWEGLDNLFLPLTCQVFLQKSLSIPANLLIRNLILLTVAIAIIAVIRRRTHLSRSAGIGAALVLYASFYLGGWRWLLGPAATMAGYALLCLRSHATQSRHHLIHAVFAVATPGLFWLYLSNATEQPTLIYPYGLAYAANFGMIAAVFFLQKTTRPLYSGIVLATILAFLLHAAPYVFVWRDNPDLLDLALAAARLLLLTSALFVCWQPQIRHCPTDAARWCRQGSLAAAISLVGAVVIYIFQPWTRPFF